MQEFAGLFTKLKSASFACKRIGIILNLTPSYPKNEEEAHVKAAEMADLWQNRLFLDASVKGYFPQELVDVLDKGNVLWEWTEDELDIIAKNTIDYLGCNYYHPARVQAPRYSPDSLAQDFRPDKYYEHYEKRGVRMNADRGWEIHPQTIYHMAKTIQEEYGNLPWFISENGMGVENENKVLDEQNQVQDNYRITFMTEHLYWLHRAIKEGANCFGYHVWTPIDCWSWRNSFKNRYGLISLDYPRQIKKLKNSAHWFKALSSSSVLRIPDDILEKYKDY